MKSFFEFVFCWGTLAFLLVGMEAVVGKYWVIGILPGFFVGFVIYKGLDRIFEEYL